MAIITRQRFILLYKCISLFGCVIKTISTLAEIHIAYSWWILRMKEFFSHSPKTFQLLVHRFSQFQALKPFLLNVTASPLQSCNLTNL